MQPRIEPDGDDIGKQRRESRYDRRHRGPLQAKLRRAEIAEDKGVICQRVDEDAASGDGGGKDRAVQRGDETAQHVVEQHRHHRKDEQRIIFDRQRDDLGFLPCHAHQWAE